MLKKSNHKACLKKQPSRLSYSLQDGLSILEVALRNALDNHLSEKISDIWYEEDFLTKDSIEKVSQAKALLIKRRERTDKEKIIAELSFGFWVNLFKKPYDKKLRINDIKRIFPNLPTKEEKLINREILFTKLKHIRNFGSVQYSVSSSDKS